MIFATGAHFGQFRKYTGDKYISHPAEVAGLIAAVGGTTVMQAASWLHDTIEDCDVTLQEIINRFGYDVGGVVSRLTEPPKEPYGGNRAKRKEDSRIRLASGGWVSQTVKLADVVSNTRNIVKQDHKFAAVYLPEQHALLQVLTKGDRVLWHMAMKQITDGLLELNLA